MSLDGPVPVTAMVVTSGATVVVVVGGSVVVVVGGRVVVVVGAVDGTVVELGSMNGSVVVPTAFFAPADEPQADADRARTTRTALAVTLLHWSRVITGKPHPSSSPSVWDRGTEIGNEIGPTGPNPLNR